MKLSVYVVGGNSMIENLFLDTKKWYVHQGSMWEHTFSGDYCERFDLLCFTGGSDVSPELYGQKNVKSHTNPDRDKIEKEFFERYIHTPKVGICRGAQLLNVLSGGGMWQDIDGHLGNHDMVDTRTGAVYGVTSTHHQMMNPSRDAEIVAVSEHKNNYLLDDKGVIEGIKGYEILKYKSSKSLCFQGHPEYSSCPKETVRYFFDLIEEIL